MTILGLNYIFHDSSACLIRDDELKFAIEEERLNRQKHTQVFPAKSLLTCLEQTSTPLSDVEHIAISIKPGKADELKLAYASTLGANCQPFLDYELHRLTSRTLGFWRWYDTCWPRTSARRPQVHFVDHHMAHVAGSYYVSPWDEAALLSVDGWGEWSTTWIGEARGGALSKLSESLFPHSLGVFYSAAKEFCGFKPNYDEGKTMGLAPTGDPSRFFNIIDSLVDVDDDGVIDIDLDWFDFPRFQTRLCGDRLLSTLGEVRRPEDDIAQHHRDAAAAFQAVLEKSILKMARILAARTGQRYLVLSGGVALNSVANGRILKEGYFDDIFVMPGAGDNGTSIGAAAYVHSHVLKKPTRLAHDSPYLGREYSNEEIEHVLTEAKVSYKLSDDIVAETARLLHEKKIVGWFQGRMEFGPRSLGGRSIPR